MKKNLIAVIMTLILSTISITASVCADTNGGFAGGTGTANDPYHIKTKQQLDNVRDYPKSHFILMNDIVFDDADFKSGGLFYNDGYGWRPFESIYGTFDGNNHKLVNVQQDLKSSDDNNMYSILTIQNYGTIKDLYIDAVVTADKMDETCRYGVICSGNNGFISGCYVSANFDANLRVSGFCVRNQGEINSCVSRIVRDKTISGTYPFGYSGFCNYNSSTGVISNCLNLSSLKQVRGGDQEQDCSDAAFVTSNSGKIDKCVNYGITGFSIFIPLESNVVISENEGTTDSYNYCPTTKNIDGNYSGLTSINSEQLYNKSTYTNLDFTSKWTINEFTGLPVPAENSFAKELKDTHTIFKTVSGLRAEAYTYNSIKLTWEKLDDAVGYQIYRSTKIHNGSYPQQIATISGGDINSYIDKNVGSNPDKMYYYHIAPVFEIEGKSYPGATCGWANSTVIDTTSSGDLSDDCIGPVIEDVTVLTDEISKPGNIKVQVKLSDESSGVTRVSVDICRNLFENTDTGVGEELYLGSLLYFNPTNSKTVTLNIPVGLEAKVGKYYLLNVDAADAAGNETFALGSLYDATQIQVKDEFDIEFRGVLSNSNIVRQLEIMDPGKTVLLTIDEESEGIMKKDILDAIKGQDKTVVVYSDEQGSSQWVFYGKDITDTTKDLDLNVKIESVSAEIYGGTGKIIQMTYANNGNLPGNVNFRLKSDYIQSIHGLDDELYLYYLNGKNVDLESSSCQVIKDGSTYWCYVDLNHNSKFLLSGKKLKNPISKYSASLSYTSTTYNGNAKKPTVKIEGLIKDQDYKVSYKNNVKAGKATVTITGAGKYGGKITKTFVINPAKITDAKLSATSYVYNAGVRTPAVTVKAGELSPATKISKDNVNIDLTYGSGRKAVGTYKVTIKGKGNYTGTITKSFKITPKKITSASLYAASYTYNGEVKKPKVTVKAGTLVAASKISADTAGIDLTYASGRKVVGTYKVTVKGKGNYTGTITKSFKINPPKTYITGLKAGNDRFTVSLKKKTAQVSGYQICYSTTSNFSKSTIKTIYSNTKVSKTYTKLKDKKRYYVKVRTYKKVNGVPYYSSWSKKNM